MMISLGICDRRYAKSAGKVVSGIPLKCPPAIGCAELALCWGVADFIYIDLHGRPDRPESLFADDKPVLHVKSLNGLPGGKIIFATTCYLPETRFYDVLRNGNVLVSGAGKNWGLRQRAIGAPLLGLWFRRFIESGFNPEQSLALAKARLVLTSFRAADRDALGFKIAPPIVGRQGGNDGTG